MEKLKVAFIDFWPEIDQENIYLPILKKYYDVEETKNNPDLIFHSIYAGFRETHTFKCKKILYLGENYRAANYKSDYSISFDPHTSTNYWLPLWQVYCILNPETKEKLFAPRTNYDSFDRFCSFTVSNGGNFMRNSFFQQMRDLGLGHVYSYGKFMMNDPELQKLSQGRHWRAPKFEFFEKYKHKYAISFENASYPGYTTEKLMDALLQGSLPFYWGDPTVHKQWNEKSFINVTRLGTSDAIDLVKKMEKDNSLFLSIYQEPVFTDEQKQRHLDNINGFESWLIDKVRK